MTTHLPIEGVTPNEHGYRVRVVNGIAIEVWRMIYNWRLVAFVEDDQYNVLHGYCYFGTGATPLMRAIAAGMVWEDPVREDPIGFDKKAF